MVAPPRVLVVEPHKVGPRALSLPQQVVQVLGRVGLPLQPLALHGELHEEPAAALVAHDGRVAHPEARGLLQGPEEPLALEKAIDNHRLHGGDVGRVVFVFVFVVVFVIVIIIVIIMSGHALIVRQLRASCRGTAEALPRHCAGRASALPAVIGGTGGALPAVIGATGGAGRRRGGIAADVHHLVEHRAEEVAIVVDAEHAILGDHAHQHRRLRAPRARQRRQAADVAPGALAAPQVAQHGHQRAQAAQLLLVEQTLHLGRVEEALLDLQISLHRMCVYIYMCSLVSTKIN